MVKQNILVASRDEELVRLQADKGLFALSLEEVRRLDAALSDCWDIRHRAGAMSVWDDLAKKSELPSVKRFRALYAEVAAGKRDEDAEFYGAMAHPDILGPATSEHRDMLLDFTATSVGIYRKMGLTGEILDAGCHSGVVASLIASIVDAPITGIDPCSEALDFGRKHPAKHLRVTLEAGSMPWTATRKFDMVLSASAMPRDPARTGAFLRSVGALLNPGGVAVIMSVGWIQADAARTRRQLRMAELGFGLADVAGGFGGMPNEFRAEGLVVLLKGGGRDYPRRIGELMESEWNRFRDYANFSACLPSEKTQSYERAKRKL